MARLTPFMLLSIMILTEHARVHLQSGEVYAVLPDAQPERGNSRGNAVTSRPLEGSENG